MSVEEEEKTEHVLICTENPLTFSYKDRRRRKRQGEELMEIVLCIYI